jgi:hypothetical protein
MVLLLEDNLLRRCIDDEGRPLEFGVQTHDLNRPVLLWFKDHGGKQFGKRCSQRGSQVSVEKVNESEPDRRRIVNLRELVKTAEVGNLRDQSGGYLLTAQSFRLCKGGANSTQASMGDAGNLSGDEKGNDKWIKP